MRDCLHCGREFEPEFGTHAFCGTWCEQSWWMSPSAGREWESIEARLVAEFAKIV